MRQINLIRKDVLVHAAIRYPMTDLLPLRPNGRGDFPSFNDEQLVRFAKVFIAERGIRGRSELRSADLGLYQALRRRLLDGIGLNSSKADNRSWAAMSDEELVLFAKTFIGENGIRFRSGLETADMSLYLTLGRRKLMDAVGFEETRRDWKSLSDEELVGFARAFIAEKRVGGRKELLKADSGLYEALRRRKLLDAAFSVLEQSNMLEAVGQITLAVKEF